MTDERVQVACRVHPGKKRAITDQLDYGEHIQDWLEAAIDEKLEREGIDVGNICQSQATLAMTAD